jgi:hypothetical protein
MWPSTMACARVRARVSQKRASSTPRISPGSGIHGFIIPDPIAHIVAVTRPDFDVVRICANVQLR